MFYFFSFASLSFYHPTPIPALSSPLASLLRSLPGLPCHSPIALRPLFCISCRLQLCTSFLCSLLVRYRYRFSLSVTLTARFFSLSFFMLTAAQHAGCSSVHSHHRWDLCRNICHLASRCTISPLPQLCAHTCHPVWRTGTVCFSNACIFPYLGLCVCLCTEMPVCVRRKLLRKVFEVSGRTWPSWVCVCLCVSVRQNKGGVVQRHRAPLYQIFYPHGQVGEV